MQLAMTLALGAILTLVLSLPMMLLWNGCLVPAVSGVKEIGWLQAWGILLLANALFKNPSHSSKD